MNSPSNIYVVDVFALFASGFGKRSTSIHQDAGRAIEVYEAAVAPKGAQLTEVRLIEVDGAVDPTKLPTTPEAWFVDRPGVTVRRHKTILPSGDAQPSITNYLNRHWPTAAALLLTAGLAAGCWGESCLAPGKIGTVVEAQKHTRETCGKFGCSPLTETIFKIQRDEDQTVCVARVVWPTIITVGDKVRGPL